MALEHFPLRPDHFSGASRLTGRLSTDLYALLNALQDSANAPGVGSIVVDQAGNGAYETLADALAGPEVAAATADAPVSILFRPHITGNGHAVGLQELPANVHLVGTNWRTTKLIGRFTMSTPGLRCMDQLHLFQEGAGVGSTLTLNGGGVNLQANAVTVWTSETGNDPAIEILNSSDEATFRRGSTLRGMNAATTGPTAYMTGGHLTIQFGSFIQSAEYDGLCLEKTGGIFTLWSSQLIGQIASAGGWEQSVDALWSCWTAPCYVGTGGWYYQLGSMILASDGVGPIFDTAAGGGVVIGGNLLDYGADGGSATLFEASTKAYRYDVIQPLFRQHATRVIGPGSYSASGDETVIEVDTTGGLTTINLDPAPVDGRCIEIKDCGGNAGTNQITLNVGGGNTIEGTGFLLLATNFAGIRLRYYAPGNVWLRSP